jgi:hypothetical protein
MPVSVKYQGTEHCNDDDTYHFPNEPVGLCRTGCVAELAGETVAVEFTA